MHIKNNTLLLFALLASTAAQAQEVAITESSIQKIGNQVEIAFTATVTALPTNYSLVLTPTLCSNSKEQACAPILVQGRKQRIMQQRTQTAIQTTTQTATPNETITYKHTVPFQTWMAGVSLRIDKQLKGCCGKETLASILLVSKALNPILLPITPLYVSDIKAIRLSQLKQIEKAYPFVYIEGDAKAKQAKEPLAISFDQAASTIDRSLARNKNFITQIKEALAMIEADPNIALTKITIMGGTSPEGTYIDNKQLGLRRAEALIDYLPQSIDPTLFDVKNIGENWNGLYTMVSRSNMEHKEAVLSIITNYGIYNGREKKLMELKQGDPYRYMLKMFFPALRKASYIQVCCTIKPNSDFAKIDQAVLLVENKTYSEALMLLQQVTPTPYVNNLIGVCYMMLQEAGKARIYLQKAVDGGDAEAIVNLDKLDYQRDNIQYN